MMVLAVLTQGLNDSGNGLGTLGALITALVVVSIGLSLGGPTGYAINPARDFGPRLFAYFAGWGKVALPGTLNGPGGFSNYFWIPIVGPLVGGIIGVLLYDLFIGDILHARLKAQAAGKPEEVPVGEAGPERETGEIV